MTLKPVPSNPIIFLQFETIFIKLSEIQNIQVMSYGNTSSIIYINGTESYKALYSKDLVIKTIAHVMNEVFEIPKNVFCVNMLEWFEHVEKNQ